MTQEHDRRQDMSDNSQELGMERFSQPYSNFSREVQITPEERVLGPKITKVFESQVKRRLPWMIEGNETISLLKTSRNGTIGADGTVMPQVREEGVIDLRSLENENISPVLSDAIRVFKGVEDYLPDFTRNILTAFRNYQGFTFSTYQWGVEEGQHGRALEEILTRAGHMSKEEIDDEYYANQSKTWEMPFPTSIEMLAYSVIQETMTSRNYIHLAAKAKEEGAPITSELLLLIARDESWHGQGYRAFYNVFANESPEDAKEALLHVGSHFRMPAHNLMRNRRKDLVATARAGAVTTDQFQETVFRTLNGFRFIDEVEAQKASEDCMKNLRI